MGRERLKMSIIKELENIKEKMCEDYCKYPLMEIPEGKDENWLWTDGSPCETCPLNNI